MDKHTITPSKLNDMRDTCIQADHYSEKRECDDHREQRKNSSRGSAPDCSPDEREIFHVCATSQPPINQHVTTGGQRKCGCKLLKQRIYLEPDSTFWYKCTIGELELTTLRASFDG